MHTIIGIITSCMYVHATSFFLPVGGGGGLGPTLIAGIHIILLFHYRLIMFRTISRIPAARLMAAASVTTAGGLGFSSAALTESTNVAISKTKFTPLTVSKNEVVGQNVHKVTLDFPNKTDILGMTTAGMLMVEGDKRDGSGATARPYTPVSRNDTVGKLELIVKNYPEVGNVSSHIAKAVVGSTLSVKGCFTKIAVKPNKWKKVGMVAGGSGITPCLQVAEELLSHPEDTTEITLIFCNQNPEAIFLRDHIDSLAAKSQGRFKVHYCVDKVGAEDKWDGLTGYVTTDMVKTYLPASDGSNNIIMVCGPPPMYKAVCGPKLFEKGQPPKQGEVTGILADLGFTPESVFKF